MDRLTGTLEALIAGSTMNLALAVRTFFLLAASTVDLQIHGPLLAQS